jgi:hypothetical protein
VLAAVFRATDPPAATPWCAAHPGRRAAPVCLVAAEAGDEAARARVSSELAERVPFDLDLIAAVGRSGLDPAPFSGVDPDDELAIAWTAALAGLGANGAEGALVSHLRSRDELVRLSALDAAVALPEQTSIAALKRARHSGSALLRAYPGLALAAAGRGDVDVVARAARSDDVEVRRLAYRLAPDVAGKDAELVALAARGAADEDAEVRRLALAFATARRLPLDPAFARAALGADALDVRVEAAGFLLSGP